MARREKRRMKRSRRPSMAELDLECQEIERSGSNKKKFSVQDLRVIRPKTFTQEEVFHAWNQGHNLVLHGSAGTGKSLLSCYLGLREVLNPSTPQDKLIIVRSAQPTKSVGHLPGDLSEKQAVYEAPYVGICNELFHWANSYENLKKAGKVQFTLTSYIRGVTLNNAIIILDEASSCDFHEIDSVITRLGDNSRIIISGDLRQSDLKTKNGMGDFMRIAEEMEEFSLINFLPQDIVRSGLVRSYILTKEKHNL